MTTYLQRAFWIGLTLLGRAHPATATTDTMNPMPFANSYAGVEYARNFPASFSQNRVGTGDAHPRISYRHPPGPDWLMGIGMQFRLLERRDQETERTGERGLALWTLSHEAYYVIRLDHPHYLLLGPTLLYMMPAKAAMLPLARETAYDSEVGVGLSAAFVRIIAPNWFGILRVDRWRGTRTTRFMAFEIAAGLARAWR